MISRFPLAIAKCSGTFPLASLMLSSKFCRVGNSSKMADSLLAIFFSRLIRKSLNWPTSRVVTASPISL